MTFLKFLMGIGVAFIFFIIGYSTGYMNPTVGGILYIIAFFAFLYALYEWRH
jgi:hypothetical protein